MGLPSLMVRRESTGQTARFVQGNKPCAVLGEVSLEWRFLAALVHPQASQHLEGVDCVRGALTQVTQTGLSKGTGGRTAALGSLAGEPPWLARGLPDSTVCTAF